MKEPTLRQRRLLEAIPSSQSIVEAAQKAGYAQSTAYKKPLRTLVGEGRSEAIEKAFSAEGVKEDIIQHQKRCIKSKNYSNVSRMLELKADIAHLRTPTSAIQINIQENEKKALHDIVLSHTTGCGISEEKVA